MQTQPTSTLIIHPSLAALPMPPESDPASQAIVASVCEIGILDPLKTCKGRVVDGRIRLRGAKVAGIDDVPTTEVSEEEVGSIILHSLIARKHFTKSALAYLVFPMLEAELAAANQRRLENLKIGVSASKPRTSVKPTFGKTIEEIAEKIGVNRELLIFAKKVHAKFADHRAFRLEWEPKILAGMCLQNVLQGIAMQESSKRSGQASEQDQLELWEFKLKGLKDVRKFTNWDSAPSHIRTLWRNEIAVTVATEWPADVRDAIFAAIRNARKEAMP